MSTAMSSFVLPSMINGAFIGMLIAMLIGVVIGNMIEMSPRKSIEMLIRKSIGTSIGLSLDMSIGRHEWRILLIRPYMAALRNLGLFCFSGALL